MAVKFASEVRWRISKRGLVLGPPSGDALLLEHPRAWQLPELLSDDPSVEELGERLGDPRGYLLARELEGAGIVVPSAPPGEPPTPEVSRRRRFSLTRSGIEVGGIDRLAAGFDRAVMPLLSRWPAKTAAIALLIAGGLALAAGEPTGPRVSSQPALDALLGLLLVLAGSFSHEFAHAVALAHYGRRARRAGFGFYWGAISFYVDSTEALTLPRRQRVIQALVGLVVDLLVVAALAVIAQFSSSAFLTAVVWRVAMLGLIEIALNAAPVLELDGHWALADYLDEPDLAHRARQAFGDVLRRNKSSEAPGWLAVYGAVSIFGGLALLTAAVFGVWVASGDLLRALFTGDPGEVVIGIVVIGPFLIGILLNTLGMVLDAMLPDEIDENPAPVELSPN